MIVGYGTIGKVINDRSGALFFASGVSNSSLPNESPEFQREVKLLLKMPFNLCCFYFSSIGIFHRDTPYFNHKKKMEQLIRSNFNNYNIIRLGNLDWDKNPNTFINAIKSKKEKNEPFEIADEFKFIISKEELVLVTDNLPLSGQNEINVFGRMAKVKDLI